MENLLKARIRYDFLLIFPLYSSDINSDSLWEANLYFKLFINPLHYIDHSTHAAQVSL